MADHWSLQEVELIVADYLSMLLDELAGRPVNKTQHRHALMTLLNNRSDGSVEFKHQNISAILIKFGLPFIKGYKPKSNYQKMLEEAVVNQLSIQKQSLEPQFERFANSNELASDILDFSSMIDSPPERESVAKEFEPIYSTGPFKINYLEREQKNLDLGMKGELLIVEYEKWRLSRSGKDSFADRVEWIAEHDDSAGFDILSKNDDGSDRYIEVKTTKLTKYTPIFFTRNEYEFSKKHRSKFYLYRLFDFAEKPKFFELEGSFDEFCRKEAVVYTGRF